MQLVLRCCLPAPAATLLLLPGAGSIPFDWLCLADVGGHSAWRHVGSGLLSDQAQDGAGRVVLAGEHASYVGCWMEGSLLSSIDAITRLHKRALEA